MLSFINPGDNHRQDPRYQEHARLERQLALLAIGAALDGRLEPTLTLFDSTDPFPVTRQLFGSRSAEYISPRPQKGSLEWWQRVRAEYVEKATQLLSFRFFDETQEDESTDESTDEAGPKPNPNNIIRYVPAYLSLLETYIVRFDNFSHEPDQNEIALRDTLVARYTLVADRVIRDLSKHLRDREFDIAYRKLNKIYNLYNQNEEFKSPRLISFEQADNLHCALVLLESTLKAFNVSRNESPCALATAIVQSALGDESLYWGQDLVPIITSILKKSWHKLYEDRIDLIDNLLNADWCKTMIALIRNDLVSIGYSRWIGLGFCYGNTRELKHAANIQSVLTRMVLDVPAIPFVSDEESQVSLQPAYPDLLAWSNLLENWGSLNQLQLEDDLAKLDVAASTVATHSRPGVYLG